MVAFRFRLGLTQGQTGLGRGRHAVGRGRRVRHVSDVLLKAGLIGFACKVGLAAAIVAPEAPVLVFLGVIEQEAVVLLLDLAAFDPGVLKVGTQIDIVEFINKFAFDFEIGGSDPKVAVANLPEPSNFLVLDVVSRRHHGGRSAHAGASATGDEEVGFLGAEPKTLLADFGKVLWAVEGPRRVEEGQQREELHGRWLDCE